jgi:hypothetical protein
MGIRETLAAVLEPALGDGWQVYEWPPSVIAPPAIVIQPADPYSAPYHATGITGAAWALDVDIVVRFNDSEEGLSELERIRETVSAALPPGWRWVEFGEIGEIVVAKKAYLKGTLGVAVATEGVT